MGFVEAFAKQRAIRALSEGMSDFLAGFLPSTVENWAKKDWNVIPYVEHYLIQRYGAEKLITMCRQGLPFLPLVDEKDVARITQNVASALPQHRSVLTAYPQWVAGQLMALRERMLELGRG